MRQLLRDGRRRGRRSFGAVLRISEETRPWWTLAGACSGLFLLMLDSTIVALALTAIKHDIGATSEGCSG